MRQEQSDQSKSSNGNQREAGLRTERKDQVVRLRPAGSYERLAALIIEEEDPERWDGLS